MTQLRRMEALRQIVTWPLTSPYVTGEGSLSRLTCYFSRNRDRSEWNGSRRLHDSHVLGSDR